MAIRETVSLAIPKTYAELRAAVIATIVKGQQAYEIARVRTGRRSRREALCRELREAGRRRDSQHHEAGQIQSLACGCVCADEQVES